VKKLIMLASFILMCSVVFAQESAVRIKDLAHVLEARDNQLIGFGLVVGLGNTGDKSQTGFTQQALTNLLSRMGVVPQNIDFKSRNVAAVMVTANLPAFAKPGQRIDVTVSSVGDATTLQGGTLLLTPLRGVDEQVYAVAQGNLLVGDPVNTPRVPYVRQRQTTVGGIPSGALVEKEIPVSLASTGALTIVLNNPDFTTADRMAATINRIGIEARASDAATVTVLASADQDLVKLIAKIENLSVVPDVVAKIIINERTGTIVIGANVRIAPVAVSYSGVDVSVGDLSLFAEGGGATALDSEGLTFRARTVAKIKRVQGPMALVQNSATLAGLVKALNMIGATPPDMIAIIQAMKKAGAIKAEVEVI
jgi:flagellar P-ring protein precursor FlgI